MLPFIYTNPHPTLDVHWMGGVLNVPTNTTSVALIPLQWVSECEWVSEWVSEWWFQPCRQLRPFSRWEHASSNQKPLQRVDRKYSNAFKNSKITSALTVLKRSCKTLLKSLSHNANVPNASSTLTPPASGGWLTVSQAPPYYWFSTPTLSTTLL